MRGIVLFTLFISFQSVIFSAVIKVPGDYPTIQQAIDAAVAGDTVLVAPGTYVENIDFKGKGITVRGDIGPDVTVIDGNQVGSVVVCRNGEGPTTVLDGFTLTNGLGTWDAMGYHGAGMYNLSSSPMVTGCAFTQNVAIYGDGGGMYNHFSSPTVTGCTFRENWGYYGGGMCNWDSSSPTITECTFKENSAFSDGAGMYIFSGSPVLAGCTFGMNLAYSKGAGLFVSSGTPLVENCTFYSGVAFLSGGGMCNYSSNPMVTNCTFSGNSATRGGGICNENTAKPTVSNTILWNNDAPEGPEIWIGDSAYPSTLTISYSDVEGGKSSVYVDPGCTLNWGPGMIDSDPLFVDAANDDNHLTFNSPCRASGDNTAVLDLYDFEGDPRIAYGTVDMGADEFYTHLYWTGDATPGGNVEIKFVGLPGTAPVDLCISTGVIDPPLKSMWGDWYLQFPILGPVIMPSIPTTGVSIVPGTIPSTYPSPALVPMQALIGAELSSLCVLEIK